MTNAPAPGAEPTTQIEEELPETAVSIKAKSLQEQLTKMQPSPAPENTNEPPALTAEEQTWKKRYGDLRKHVQKKEVEFNEKVTTLSSQVEQLSKASTQPMPKTQEEFDAWCKQYPDIVGFIELIADKKASERAKVLEEQLTGVTTQLQQTKEDNAMATLKLLVPDLEAVLSSQAYADWKVVQPVSVQNILDSSDDPDEIAYFVNLYKASGKKTTVVVPKVNKVPEVLDAPPTKGSGVEPTVPASGYLFTTSQIKAMTPKEYDANEAAIDSARVRGLIMDDGTKRRA